MDDALGVCGDASSRKFPNACLWRFRAKVYPVGSFVYEVVYVSGRDEARIASDFRKKGRVSKPHFKIL